MMTANQEQRDRRIAFAPLALFVYNRPTHLARTLNALKASPLASASELHVFSDGPRHASDRPAVEQVRQLIRGIEGFGMVHLHEQEDNLGLSRSIIEGVTALCEKHGKVIVLEDDMIVAPGFLSFMNRALSHFLEEPRVMQISGYMFPITGPEVLGSTLLSRVPASWGWGTWERAWKHLERDSEKLLHALEDDRSQHEFNLQGAYPYMEQLRLHARGELDVWGVRWYASMFMRGGLCLYPGRSLVQNIGMDGSGIHCGASRAFDIQLSQEDSWRFPECLEESELALKRIREFLMRLSGEGEETAMGLLARARVGVDRLYWCLSREKRSTRNDDV